MPITTSAITLNELENALIAPDMFSTPIHSIIEVSARVMRVCTFSIAVPMPCVASRACCSKLAKPSSPLVFKSITAALKSSIVSVPSLSALYKSFELAPAPKSDCATWFNCPGITSCKVFQSCISGTPLESICVYCCIARDTSAVLAPDASIMLLSASPKSVASSSPEVSGASCCTIDATLSVEEGKPSSELDILEIEAEASSALYPRFCITFG